MAGAAGMDGLETGPAFCVNPESGSALDLTQEHPQLRDGVLRIGGQCECVALAPHEEVPATGLRRGEAKPAQFADEVSTLAGKPARHARPSWSAVRGHG